MKGLNKTAKINQNNKPLWLLITFILIVLFFVIACDGDNGCECTDPCEILNCECDDCKEKEHEAGCQCEKCKEIEPDPQYKDLKDFISNDMTDISNEFISANSIQGVISNRLQNVLIPGLRDQSGTLAQQYANWESELRGGAGLDDPRVQFASNIKSWQNGINSDYRNNGDGDEILRIQGPDFDNIVDAICGMFNDPNAANLFRARLQAFQKSTYVSQRRFMNEDGSQNTHEAELASLYITVEQLSGKQLPQGADAAKALITDLIDTIPESCGPGKYNLLMQLKNFSQFQGWVNDVQARGLNPVSISAASNKLHTNIISPRIEIAEEHATLYRLLT